MKKKITMKRVVAGLRFLAENRDLSTKDLVKGLKKLGCDWTFEDWEVRFGHLRSISDLEGIRLGMISCGASVIINLTDACSKKGAKFNRYKIEEWFLNRDDDYSIYSFIRLVTGDDSYTKENIERRHNHN